MASTISFKQMCPSCEALIPIRDPKLIGRKVECPKCKYRFVVEEPEEPEDDAPKKGKKDGEKKGAKGEKGAKGPKGKKEKAKAKKGGSSNMVLIGAVLAGLAIVGLVIALFVLPGSDSKPSGGTTGGGSIAGGTNPGDGTGEGTSGDGTPGGTSGTTSTSSGPLVENLTNILPNETESVIVFSPEEMQKSALRRAMLGTPGGFRDVEFLSTFGFPFHEVSQVLIAKGEIAKGQNWIFSILRAKKPLNKKYLTTKFRMSPEAPVQGLESFTVGRGFDPLGNLLLKGSQERPSFRAHFLDDQTIVFADKQPMDAWLNAGGKPTLLTQPPAAPSTPTIPEDPTMTEDGMTEDGMTEMGDGMMEDPTMSEMDPMGMMDPSGQKPRPASVKANWLSIKPELKVVLDKMDNGKPAILLMAEDNINRALQDFAVFKKSSGAVLPLGETEDTEKQMEAVTALIPMGIKRAGCSLRKLSEDRLVATVSLDTTDQTTAQIIRASVNKAFGLTGSPNDPNLDPSMVNPNDPMATEFPMTEFPMPAEGSVEDPNMMTDPSGNPMSQKVQVLVYGKTVIFNIDAPLPAEAYKELTSRTEMLAVYLKSEAAMVGAHSRVHDLAAALQKYVQEKKQFPRGTAERDDVGRLTPWAPDQRVSWMAEILPHLSGNYGLEVNPSLSWDEGSNQRIAQVVIPEFLVPSGPGARYRVDYPGIKSELAPTHFVGIAGIGLDAAEYPADNAAMASKLGVFGYSRSTKLEEIKDGPENTIALLQVPGDHNTPWLAGGGSTVRGISEEPDALAHFGGAVDPKTNQKGAYAIMADGKVRFIPENIDLAIFRGLCTINGGEKIEGLDTIAPVVPGEAATPMTTAPETPVVTNPPTAPPMPKPVDTSIPPVVSESPMDPPPKTNPSTGLNNSPFAIRDRAKIQNELKQIVLAYHNHHDTANKGPSKVEDLAPFLDNNARLIKAIKDGEYIVFWDVKFVSLTEGTSNTILVYQPEAKARDGYVAMADGSVKRMSAAEFEKAPKAGTPK